jgi:hypothetical protein
VQHDTIRRAGGYAQEKRAETAVEEEAVAGLDGDDGNDGFGGVLGGGGGGKGWRWLAAAG